MRKGLLLVFFAFWMIDLSAQTATRLKSWGYLESPPAPVKSFSTSTGGFQIDYIYPTSRLHKVNMDGSRTFLANLRQSVDAKSFQYRESETQVMFAYSTRDSVFFYATDGTPAKTKLLFAYLGSGTHQFDFTLHKGKAYVAYDTGWNYFKGLVEIDLADYKSRIVFNKSSEDIQVYSVVSDGENLWLNYRNGTINNAFIVNPADGSLTSISDQLTYWIPQRPFVLLDKTLGAFTLENVRVSMNGSSFETKRMLLSKYNTTTKTFDPLWNAGYFQAEQPSYLGEINGKHYFFTTGDLDIKDCQSTSCSGNVGAYLWEVGNDGYRLVKGHTSSTEKYTYEGKKQVASDKIFLEINSKSTGKELWVATPNDFYMVKDHVGEPSVLRDYGLKLEDAAVCGGKIAIPGVGAVKQGINDYELYISDGTAGNVTKIDIMPKTGVSSMAKGLVNVMDKILFIAADTITDNLGIAMTSMYSLDLCNLSTSASREFQSHLSGELKAFPNPAKNELAFDVAEAIEKLEIRTVTGQLVLRRTNPEKRIDVGALKNGLYLIQLQTKKQNLSGKILIAK